MSKAIRVSFDGGDGSGKTTGLTFLADKLESMGYKVLRTREVGNPHVPACVKLRELVLDPTSGLDGKSMELIFSAMRIENERFYEKVEGDYDFILSDRGWLSHLAYTDGNVDEGFTNLLYMGIMDDYTPNKSISVYFRVDPDVASQRRAIRNGAIDVIEAKGTEFQRKVITAFESYLTAPSVSDHGVFVVDANQTIDNVRSQLESLAANLAAAHKSQFPGSEELSA